MNRDDFDYQVALRDCQEKLAALPARLEAEFDAAMEERRQPFPIQPVSALRADLVVAAIKKIGANIPEPIKDICRDQLRACSRLGKEVVGLNSDHLAAILDAAGIAPKESIVAKD